MDTASLDRNRYELRFQSLADRARVLAFPCDEAGRVDLDTLGRRVLNDYLYARVFIGREFAPPSVRSRAWVA